MQSKHSEQQRQLVRAMSAVLILCALGACKKEQAATGPEGANAPVAGQQAAAPQQAVSAQVAAMSPEQLREAAGTALREQRLYAPAGNNALEYYAALRDKQPNDAAVSSALTDLMPYTVIAAEQSIGRDDFAEAQRLYALMAKVDPQAPALPRLKQGIADAQTSLAQRTAAAEAQTVEEAQRLAELEKARLEEQQRAQQQAAQQLAQQQSAAAAPAAAAATTPAQPSAAERAAEQRAAEQRAAEQRAAEQRQAAAAASAPAAASPAPAAASPPAATAIRAISTPSPQYPAEALRDGRQGEVIVEFTVNPDGSVSDPRVVRSNPPRVFDRAALSAVRRWRFQPVASATTTRRTIGFNPGG